MIFTTSKPLSTAEMNQKLLAMAKDQKRDVYAVETMGGEAPRLDELDNRSLRSEIIAAGSDPYVNESLGTLPQTTIVPSLLFGDIGVKRATEEQQKLPYYPPPPLAK
jgi:hypothetical protein